jgi:hypothetical protein
MRAAAGDLAERLRENRLVPADRPKDLVCSPRVSAPRVVVVVVVVVRGTMAACSFDDAIPLTRERSCGVTASNPQDSLTERPPYRLFVRSRLPAGRCSLGLVAACRPACASDACEHSTTNSPLRFLLSPSRQVKPWLRFTSLVCLRPPPVCSQCPLPSTATPARRRLVLDLDLRHRPITRHAASAFDSAGDPFRGTVVA